MPDNPNRYIPNEHSLDVDRSFTAKTVTTDINRWKKNTNKLDLKGFDTTRQKLPSPRKVMNREGIGYIEREPDRFVRNGQVAYDLLKRQYHRFYDYRSFVEALRRAWTSDASLRTLLENSNERDFRALFETGRVQGWLRENIKEVGIAGLMERFSISLERAGRIWNRLPDVQKDRVIQSVMGGKRFNISRATQMVQPREPIRRARTRYVQQVARTGRTYRRAIPQKWTNLEIRFITNRRRQDPNIKVRRLVEEHNAIFRNTPRSYTSMRNKVYRLGL